MRVLLTGAGGQLGRALMDSTPTGLALLTCTHAELDIADADAVHRVLTTSRPSCVINAAAYTQVDAAEADPAGARRANVDGPGFLAAACREVGARLLHVSTDYVFDGRRSEPYTPDASPNPVNVYGATKLEGEMKVRSELPDASCIVRASWLYAATGRNFLTRMLTLMAERQQLAVVIDQVSAPTAASSLARALWAFATRESVGLYHWCDSGVASWYDFAVAIADEALAVGFLERVPEIRAIRSADYPTAARRPAYSLLDKAGSEALLGYHASHWHKNLRVTVASLVGRRQSEHGG